MAISETIGISLTLIAGGVTLYLWWIRKKQKEVIEMAKRRVLVERPSENVPQQREEVAQPPQVPNAATEQPEEFERGEIVSVHKIENSEDCQVVMIVPHSKLNLGLCEVYQD